MNDWTFSPNPCKRSKCHHHHHHHCMFHIDVYTCCCQSNYMLHIDMYTCCCQCNYMLHIDCTHVVVSAATCCILTVHMLLSMQLHVAYWHVHMLLSAQLHVAYWHVNMLLSAQLHVAYWLYRCCQCSYMLHIDLYICCQCSYMLHIDLYICCCQCSYMSHIDCTHVVVSASTCCILTVHMLLSMQLHVAY